MGYSRKKTKQGGGWGHTLLKNTPVIFCVFTLLLKIPDKTKLHPWKFHKIVLHPLAIPHDFFLVTPGNSTLFLINPQKFHMLFLDTLGNYFFNPQPLFFFSGIAQCSSSVNNTEIDSIHH